MLKVKNVKVNKSLSEETLCFSCDVYENDKLVAYAKNRGCGGNTDIQPAKGLTYDDIKHLDDLDTECEIMDMVELTNIIKTKQSRSFVMKDKKGNIYTSKFPKPITKLKKSPNFNSWLSSQKNIIKKQGFELLNTNL